MSIIIENITDIPTLYGVNKYRLRINQKVITEFYHTREEGLGACLRKAADAADKADLDYITSLIEATYEIKS